jgi:hypothetical protein
LLVRAAGFELRRVAAGSIEIPFSISCLPRDKRWDEHVLPPSQRLRAAFVFSASAALLLCLAAISALAILGVLK